MDRARIKVSPVLEVCENCIWWCGDNSGMQGYCWYDPETTLITGRYEDCSQFLDRYLIIPLGEDNE